MHFFFNCPFFKCLKLIGIFELVSIVNSYYWQQFLCNSPRSRSSKVLPALVPISERFPHAHLCSVLTELGKGLTPCCWIWGGRSLVKSKIKGDIQCIWALKMMEVWIEAQTPPHCPFRLPNQRPSVQIGAWHSWMTAGALVVVFHHINISNTSQAPGRLSQVATLVFNELAIICKFLVGRCCCWMFSSSVFWYHGTYRTCTGICRCSDTSFRWTGWCCGDLKSLAPSQS